MSDETDILIFGKIILYYVPWCCYSLQLLPDWGKFKEYAKTNLKKLEVIDINCNEVDNNVLVKNKIEAYPTIILYTNNKKIQFNDERKMEKLIDFILQNGYEEEKEEKEDKDHNKQININNVEINITI